MSTISIHSLLLLGQTLWIDTASCNYSAVPTESLAEPTTPPSTRPHHRPHPDDEGCKLLDSFAILVQMALVSSALITLFYKRSRERPQRPVLVWALDVSKQFAGAAVIHFLNLAISYIAGRPRNGGPKTNLCVWYFLNVAVDTTLGVAILWGWLHLIQSILTKLGVKQLETGRYGPPPVYRMLMPWFKQTCVFILAESLMKLCVYGMFRHLPFLFAFGEWVLRWTKGNYRYQVIFVMLVFPLIMNMIQFWIVDTIVKVSPNKFPISVATSPAVTDQETDQQSEVHDEHSPLLPK